MRENSNRVDHDYKVGDKLMLVNNSAYKSETPYNILFVITMCCTNGTVILHCCATKIRHNICRINPYKSDINVEDVNIEKYVRQ